MWEYIPLIVRGINALITIAFFPQLYRLYKEKNKKFYLYWGTGFLLYGINILLRITILLHPSTSLIYQLFSFVVLSVGFSLIMTGIGELVNRRTQLFLASMTIPVFIIILYLTIQSESVARIVAILPFLVVSVSLLVIRIKYSVNVDLFIVGWWLLLVSNILYVALLIGDLPTDIFAIFSKILLYFGMITPQFTLLAEDIERFLISGGFYQYTDNIDWNIAFVESEKGREEEIDWIRQRLEQNASTGLRTIFVTVYDLISINELQRRGLMDSENLYVIRVSQSRTNTSPIFSEKVMDLYDDISELDMLFKNIIEFSNQRGVNCQIILNNISMLIHTHGWKRLYSFLIANTARIKSSNVQVYFLYIPSTHSNKPEINTITSIADRIIKI